MESLIFPLGNGVRRICSARQMGQQTTAGILFWEDIRWQDCKTKNTARLGLERSRCLMGRRIRSSSSLRWKYGTALVPAGHVEGDVKLGRWVTIQRRTYLEGSLPKERQERLKVVHASWAWSVREAQFEGGIEAWQVFARKDPPTYRVNVL